MRLFCFAACLLLSIFSLCAEARSPSVDVKSLLERSNWIIEVTVKDGQSPPVLHDEYGALAVVSVVLDRKIYGEPFKVGGEKGVLEFLVRPDMLESPEFTDGKKYVVFWHGRPPFVANDHYAARAVGPGGCVDTGMISGLPASISVDTLASLAAIYKNDATGNSDVEAAKALSQDTCVDNSTSQQKDERN